ncbi:MAG TPA: hypothetical protein PLX77_00590 [Candidatus Cloacimonadota bacterium]|nr:hypothetical protein [Candidatus Cloacimonadota bacterium]
MKKILILLCLFVCASAVLLAQEAQPQGNGNVYIDEEEIIIDVKALAPESGIYKAKSETYTFSGKYRFVLNDQIVRENSEILLNKWLKESK